MACMYYFNTDLNYLSFNLCTKFKALYLTVAHLVVVLVSHVDLERVDTCKGDNM